jgi:CheY-like chemotaxis protein
MAHHILVVDDAQTLRDLARMTLEVLGNYEVETATNGLEAKEALESGRRFDLVLTDLDMPLMGGDELIAWMKSEPSLQNVPVIVLTAGVDRIRQEIAQKYEVSAFLIKPFQPKQLAEAINKVLS